MRDGYAVMRSVVRPCMQRWPWLQAEAAKERERLRAELEKDKARS